MVSKLGLIPKTSTLARIYGIQFSEVYIPGLAVQSGIHDAAVCKDGEP